MSKRHKPGQQEKAKGASRYVLDLFAHYQANLRQIAWLCYELERPPEIAVLLTKFAAY